MIKNKKIHLEILRLIAIYFVIFNHTGVNAYQAYATKEPGSLLYNIYLIMAIVCKIAVPLFFMISGATLLGKTESIKDLYFKRIFKNCRNTITIFIYSILKNKYEFQYSRF